MWFSKDGCALIDFFPMVIGMLGSMSIGEQIPQFPDNISLPLPNELPEPLSFKFPEPFPVMCQ
jgi:hypothetical protein